MKPRKTRRDEDRLERSPGLNGIFNFKSRGPIGDGAALNVGARGSVTGKGGDLLILDDTTDEQQAVSDPSVYEKVLSWYTPWVRKDNP
jgi:hypothetical protein